MARGPVRHDAILASTIAVLGDKGYAGLTMDSVAAHAHASKATIYRRWPNKAGLVAAALDALDAGDNAAIPDTGALRSDLVAVIRAVRKKSTEAYVAMIHDLVVASRHDAELAEALRHHVENEGLSPFHEVLARAKRRGDIPKNTDFDLIHDVAEALIVRQLGAGLTFDAAFVTRIVDRVLLPLLQSGRAATRTSRKVVRR